MNTKLLATEDSSDSLRYNSLWEDALLVAQKSLKVFASEPDFGSKMELAFGKDFNLKAVQKLQKDWLESNFLIQPDIAILSAEEMNGAWGAFAHSTNTIYFSQEFLSQNRDNPEIIARLWLEEFGHFVDRQINEEDSPGDEGAIFAALVQEGYLDEQEIQQLKTEDDSAVLNLKGQLVAVEQADGVFTWINSSSGSWDEVSNWENNLAPGEDTGNYDVLIDVAGDITTTHSTGNTAINDLNSEEAFTLSGGTLTANIVDINNTFTLNGGTLANATVELTGGSLTVTFNDNNRLSGVTLNGDVELNQSATQLHIDTDLNLNGILTVNSGNLWVEGSQTWETGRVVLESLDNRFNAYLWITGADGTTFTLGPQATLSGGWGQVDSLGANAPGNQNFVNQGLIAADISGKDLTINTESFTNEGTLQAINGGIIVLPNNSIQTGIIEGNSTIDATTLVNSGTINPGIGTGVLTLNGNLTQDTNSLSTLN